MTRPTDPRSEPHTWTGTRPRWPVRAWNATLRGLDRIGIRRGPLTPETILRAARRRTGLDDLGGGDLDEPLALLAADFEANSTLSPFGRGGARSLLRVTLERRLQVVDALRRDPDAGREEVRRPLFVVGLPRTGTTLLFNLLAQHPRARALHGWEAMRPVAPRGPRIGRTDSRKRQYRRALRGLDYLAPGFQTVHPVHEDGPEEDIPLLLRSLVTWAFLLYADLPRYEAWLWRQERSRLEETYRFHRGQLQLLQRQRAGPSGGRETSNWVLKSPSHLNALHALLQVHPDACIVQTHRRLERVLPSSCSLLAVFRGLLADDVDPHALGRSVLAMRERTFERMLAVRAEVAPERILDVRFDDLVGDPAATVRRIHEHFDYGHPDGLDDDLRAWLRANPPHARGRHAYSLGQFGLDPAEVAEAGRAYHERFGLGDQR